MRREDVRPLLEQATDRMPEPDLADEAWAGGLTIRSRRRRSTTITLVMVVLIAITAAVVAGLSGTNGGLVPPTTPPTHLPGYVPSAGQIAGIDFWLAPPSGSERYLDRVGTPLGDSLRLPDHPADLRTQPLDQVAAVVLAPQPGGYRPMLLGRNGRWAQVDEPLTAIVTGPPLVAGAVSPNGQLVAFPQPGAVVVIDATSAATQHFNLPTKDIRSVSWLQDSQRLLVSGPLVAYRVLVGPAGSGEESIATIAFSSDSYAATAPYRLDGRTGQAALLRYGISSGWTVETTSPELPVTSWVGQTFTAGTNAARLFVASQLPQVPTSSSAPQVVAAISVQQTLPSHLLVLGETPATTPTPGRTTPDAIRTPGCCFMLGWYDSGTVLLQVEGWVLAWQLQTGQVRRVTELEVDGVALGPGIRG